MCSENCKKHSVFQSVCYLSTHFKVAQCHSVTAMWTRDGRPAAQGGRVAGEGQGAAQKTPPPALWNGNAHPFYQCFLGLGEAPRPVPKH